MASAVHTVTSSSAAALHAHGAGKAHGNAAADDSFADMLAAADDAAQTDDAGQASPVATNKVAKAKPSEDTAAAETDDKDAAQEPTPALLAALTQTAAKPQTSKDAGKTDGDKPTKTDEPANDNETAQQQPALPQQPVMPMAAAQPAQAQTQTPVSTDGKSADGIAPLAANDTAAPQTTQATQPQGPDATDQDEAVAENTAAAPPPADKAAAKAQTAKAAKPADFKKALDGAKGTTPTAATTTQGSGDAAGAKADTKQDAKQADARPADAQAAAVPAPAAATHNATPQPDAPGVNAAAPAAQSAAPTPNNAVAQGLPMPASHHTPDMNGLAVEIAAKSQSGAKQFDIRLDPPELGRVEVRLSIDATGKASAHLSADQPQTLDLLRKDSTSLTQALRDAGLNVSQDGLNFSLRHQTGQDQQQHMQGGRTFRTSLTAPTPTEPANVAAATGRNGLGLLDIKV